MSAAGSLSVAMRGVRWIAPFRTYIQPTLSSADGTYQEFSAKNLRVQLTKKPSPKPPATELFFGHVFTDHMLVCDWQDNKGWSSPRIEPFGPLNILPSASVLQYAIQCFEGLKAFKSQDGRLLLFRPGENIKRLKMSAARVALPDFDGNEFLHCMKELVKVDADWIPDERGYSLYLRPTMIGTQDWLGVGASRKAILYVIASPVGPYYRTGFSAVRLRAEGGFARAWPGGTGAYKIGANYAGGILPLRQANEAGFQSVIWLNGPDDEITEVGTMNMFVFWKRQDGRTELITPSLESGLILPGVIRDSVLRLVRGWNECVVSEGKITMSQLVEAVKEGRVLEVFGTGTAALIAPVKAVWYRQQEYAIPMDPNNPRSEAGPLAQRIWDEIMAIQYGNVRHEWSVKID